jgi:hypothetical protein
LEKETIGFYYGYDRTPSPSDDPSLARQLSYELRPDGRWDIVIYALGANHELSRKSFPIGTGRADSIRKQLWRLRPEQLDGVAKLHDPSDCPPPPTDTPSALSVGFIQTGSKPGISDDRVGVFTLPDKAVCNTPKSIAARELIERIVSSLPGANLRRQFRYGPVLG